MIRINRLPEPLRMTDIAVLIATGFGSGRLTPAPGTWGSIAAWVIGIALLMSSVGKAALILAFALACLAGWWAVEQIEERTQEHDAGMIVIDEWAGLWLTMLFSPRDPVLILLCLVLFRVFDIWKPGPIGWLDKHVHGPVGVMIDDIAAGLAAAACIGVISLWIH